MAKLKILGSGSSGNGYVIECEDESIVLELGVPYNRYLLNTDISKVAACLVSHVHQDHYKPTVAKRFGKMGIPIYSNEEVAENSGISAKKFDTVKALPKAKAYQIGTGFIVQPFSLPHSAKNYGWLIRHNEFGKLLFATDLSAFPYRFKGVNHWMIEANYDADIIIDGKLSGNATRSNYSDHLSWQNCRDAMLESWDGSAETVTLIHLSDDNSNAEAFRERIKDAIGFPNVSVAIGGETAQTVELTHRQENTPSINQNR